MTAPARLHRSRALGARLAEQCDNPAGWVCVTRPGPWGNPFKVVPHRDIDRGPGWAINFGHHLGPWRPDRDDTAAWACHYFTRRILSRWDLTPLVGRDLACYCRPATPCHGDVLIALANHLDLWATCPWLRPVEDYLADHPPSTITHVAAAGGFNLAA